MARSANNLNAVLQDTANAIKAKKSSSTKICPRDFADEIAGISTGITPTGTINITSNNTYDVTNYASANVNVGSNIKPVCNNFSSSDIADLNSHKNNYIYQDEGSSGGLPYYTYDYDNNGIYLGAEDVEITQDGVSDPRNISWPSWCEISDGGGNDIKNKPSGLTFTGKYIVIKLACFANGCYFNGNHADLLIHLTSTELDYDEVEDYLYGDIHEGGLGLQETNSVFYVDLAGNYIASADISVNCEFGS